MFIKNWFYLRKDAPGLKRETIEDPSDTYVNIVDVNSPNSGNIISVEDFTALIQPYAVAATGTNISFAVPQVYNTRTTPATGNLTNTLTGSRRGVVQKIYHNSLIAPSMPVDWVLVGEGFYIPGTLNIIYAEWSEGTTVEYWVTQ